ncbi:hypothetical protein B0H10DRAFT_2225413 [Mycena sp. CBHHK59/15]|nr:hypothetical protein B0H10DRAFT_2225413 [Mycena sp. CBHHK59/15]
MSSITLRRCTIERKTGKTMYDGIFDDAQALGTNLCAMNSTRPSFEPSPTSVETSTMRTPTGTSFGTWMAAYPKNSPPANKLPYAYPASKSHRMVLALWCPTGGQPATYLFVNGVAVCDAIRAADEAQEKEMGKNFDITEWITCGESEGGSEAIEDIVLLLRLHKTYEVHVYNLFRRQPSSEEDHQIGSTEKSSAKSDGSGDVDMDAAAQVTERRWGYVPPEKLPTIKAIFAHDKTKLVHATTGTSTAA